jgi:hypothetical protein
MAQELITLPKLLNSPSVFSTVRVARNCFMCNLLQIVVFPFGYCVVRPSIYSFWLPFGIFILFPTVMPLLWCMASDYLFGIFKLLATVLSVPWYTASDCHFGSFNIVSTVLYVRHRLTGSHYPLGIFKHSTIVLSFLLRFTVSDYPFDIFNVYPLRCLSFFHWWLLITPVVSSNFWPLTGMEISVLRWYTTSDYNLDKGLSCGWSYGSGIYNYLCNQCLPPLTLWVRIPFRWSVLDITLCDKVCQWLAAGRWFSPSTLISSSNKTDRHYITEILFKSDVKHHTRFDIFWLHHWYLLITPLVFSDYPFGIFWLPIGYLLTTPLVSSLSVFLWLTASDYPIGIFWLPHLYILITPLVSSD